MFKPLVIGDLVAKIPIIQGGMGVGVSLAGLAGAVAAEGGIGVISSAQIGYGDPLFNTQPLKANLAAIEKNIKAAREKARNGVLGINIMTVYQEYEQHVRKACECGIDLIISGAGLPINLPALVEGFKTKVAPIISSTKALNVLLGMWERRYNKTADAVIIEGPLAGGHLGFKYEELDDYLANKKNYDDVVVDIIKNVKIFADKFKKHIPVIFAGGVFTKKDIEHYINLGCDGVQIATRFIATKECDAPQEYKDAIINCTQEDIAIIKSPVGMPGRAIINNFAKEKIAGIRSPINKCWQCLKCDLKTTPYCITERLINTVKGVTDTGLLFTGQNGYRVKEMTTVNELIRELTE